MSTDNPSATPTIDTLRELLFQTLREVRAGTMDTDRARAVNELGKPIVDSARVEVAYLAANNGGESEFLGSAVGAGNLPPGITGIRQHRLK